MKKCPGSLIAILICVLISACNKERQTSLADNSINDLYNSGGIRFQFYKINPGNAAQRQEINYMTLYEKPEEQWMCGYFWPDRRWMSMVRTSISAQEVRVGLHFTNIHLDSLPLPFTFDGPTHINAIMSYCLGYEEYYDSSGRYLGSYNVYTGDTKNGDFKITLLSKLNHRFTGTFSGTIRHSFYDDRIKIENGVFDIAYVVR